MNKAVTFFLILNLGIGSLCAEKGCQGYCESVKTCCQEANTTRPFSEKSDCKNEYRSCLLRYKETESDKCPYPEECD